MTRSVIDSFFVIARRTQSDVAIRQMITLIARYFLKRLPLRW